MANYWEEEEEQRRVEEFKWRVLENKIIFKERKYWRSDEIRIRLRGRDTTMRDTLTTSRI